MRGRDAELLAPARGAGAGDQRPGGAGAAHEDRRHCGARVHGARAHAVATQSQGYAVFREIYQVVRGPGPPAGLPQFT